MQNGAPVTTQTGAYNTYVGARYVPKLIGTWDNTQNYEPLCIVIWEGNSYTSKQYVPSGIDITNQNYWVMTGNFNGQLAHIQEQIDRLNSSETVVLTADIPIGLNIIGGVESFEGWENVGNGYQHTVGNTNPLTFNVNVVPEELYFVSFVATSNTNINMFSVSLGGSEVIYTYFGGNTYNYVLRSKNNAPLIFTPLSNYNGTISNLAVYKVTPGSTNIVTLPVNNYGPNFNDYMSGFWNVGIGGNALESIIAGRSNIAIGEKALQFLENDNQNIAIGTFAGETAENSYRNIMIGCDAMEFASQAGDNNVALGQTAMGNFTTCGRGNVAIGASAYFGSDRQPGNYNVVTGFNAGFKLDSDECILIGMYAGNGATQSGAIPITAKHIIMIGAYTGPIDGATFIQGDINIGNTLKGSATRDVLSYSAEPLIQENVVNKGKKFQIRDKAKPSYVQVTSDVADGGPIGGMEFVCMDNNNTAQPSRRAVGTIRGVRREGNMAGQAGCDIIISLKAPDGPFNDRFILTSSGRVGILTTNPKAGLDIKAQSAATPALVLEPGALSTTPVNGAMEYDGTHLYFTVGSERKQLI